MAGLILYCKHNNEFAPVTLENHHLYADVVRIITDRFKLKRDGVLLCYVVRGGEKCLLRNQEEMKDMVSLFNVLGERLVNIEVSDVAIVEHRGECSVGSSCVLDEIEYEVADSSSRGECSQKIYKTAAWVDCITGVGQVFKGGAVEFREALQKFCIASGREFLYDCNKKKRIIAYCKLRNTTGCGWLIKATYKIKDKEFKIRSFDKEHDCNKTDLPEKNKRVNSELLAGILKDKVTDCPSLRPSAVLDDLRRDYGMEVSYFKIWLAIEKAKGKNIGNAADSYNQLECYIDAVESTNPGSCFKLDMVECGSDKRFKRLFFAFAGCIAGFKYVRPMLFIDGTFLKGKFKGVLLSAVGKNGNQGLYPLAFGVVDSENLDNWQWFLENLRDLVGLEREMLFFSDRHHGLLEAMPRVFPNATHCYCLQHLKDNLKTKFGGGGVFFGKRRNELVKLLGECASAETVPLFQMKLQEVLILGGVKVKNFLEAIPLEKWTTAYRTCCHYGESTSNAVESFNSWALDFRELPVTEMIDKLRIKLMVWFDARKTRSEKWKGPFSQYYQKKWSDSVHDSRGWQVKRSSCTKFEVFSQPSHSVDLVQMVCTCQLWQINGFPCKHAVICIMKENLDPKAFVEEYFYAEYYRKSYDVPIDPVPTSIWRPIDSEVCVQSNILPPVTKRPPGRPKNKRIPTWGEVVSKKKMATRCGRCEKFGHNRRTCKEPI